MKHCIRFFFLLVSIPLFAQNDLFEYVLANESGINFTNKVTETEEQNIFMKGMPYFYAGGGVAAADFDNDNLTDLFFIGNQVNCALYLNKGNLRFEDATSSFGIKTSAWCTGIAVADVNGDGWTDVYITKAQNTGTATGGNILLINDKGKKFIDKTAEFKIGFNDRFLCASFFDMDTDGDMDLYLPRYPDNTKFGNDINFDFNNTFKKGYGTDLLLENINNEYFKDISAEAGILPENGFGISVLTNDFNNDGLPDIYVGNDFSERDFLYLNNGNKTFTESLTSKFSHSSFFTMGADYADLNNDLRPDLITLDMNPRSLIKYKTDFSGFDYDIYKKTKAKYYNQEIRNTLQIQNTDGTYSDIAQIDKVAFTDWSWSPLIADFDLDGFKDIFITNGLKKDILNQNLYMFTLDSILKSQNKGWGNVSKMQTLSYIDSVPLPNYFFKNNTNSRFTDVTHQWLSTVPSVSTGAATADLDNDGDLEIIVNNIDTTPFIYLNKARELSSGNFVALRININRTPLTGAKAIMHTRAGSQILEVATTKGFQSQSSPTLLFGLDTATTIDSILIVLPANRGIIALRQPAVNTYHTINTQETSAQPYSAQTDNYNKPLHLSTLDLHDTTALSKDDFKYQPLLLQTVSQTSPTVAVYKLNNDTLEDIIYGAFNGRPPYALLQQADGSFSKTALPTLDSAAGYNWTKIYFEDLNNDNRPELIAACTDFYLDPLTDTTTHRNFLPIYTLNNTGSIPAFSTYYAAPPLNRPVAAAAIADIDRNGFKDIMAFPGTSIAIYPNSFDLIKLSNFHGHLSFTAIEFPKVNRDLGRMLFSDAGHTDIDNDQYPEIYFTGPFTRPYMLRNIRGDLNNPIMAAGLGGLWSKVVNLNINTNPKPDALLMNFGVNHRFNLLDENSLSLVSFDFDQNGQMDPMLCATINNKHYPIYTYRVFNASFPYARKKTYNYDQYSTADLTTVFDSVKVSAANIREALRMKSQLKLDDGSLIDLPYEAQWTSLNDALIDTTHKIIYLAGNNLHVRYDLGYNDAAALIIAPYHLQNGQPVFDKPTVYNPPLTEIKQLFFITMKGRQHLLLNTNQGLYTLPL